MEILLKVLAIFFIAVSFFGFCYLMLTTINESEEEDLDDFFNDRK